MLPGISWYNFITNALHLALRVPDDPNILGQFLTQVTGHQFVMADTNNGMVQAWVAHFVTPLKCMYDKYDWQVRNHTKSTNHLTNTITMVVKPLVPPAAWI